MSFMTLEPDLKKLGLSDKEAAVYLAALGLGSSTVQQISRKAKVARATTYLVLESLREQGLITRYTKEGKTLFVAEPPIELARIVEAREKAVKKSKEYLGQLLPKLEAFMKHADTRPEVRYYAGLEGLKTMRSELSLRSRPNDLLYSFSPSDDLRKTFGEDFTHTKQRTARHIKAKIIFTTRSKELKQRLLAEATKNNQRKFLPPQQYKSKAGMTIGQDFVAIGVFDQKKGGIIIESETVALMMRELFDALWNGIDD